MKRKWMKENRNEIEENDNRKEMKRHWHNTMCFRCFMLRTAEWARPKEIEDATWLGVRRTEKEPKCIWSRTKWQTGLCFIVYTQAFQFGWRVLEQRRRAEPNCTFKLLPFVSKRNTIAFHVNANAVVLTSQSKSYQHDALPLT